jgi:quercetin dioxygenase-like cupin family protein
MLIMSSIVSLIPRGGHDVRALQGQGGHAAASEGEPFWYDGGLMTMKARPDQTGGSISMVDVLVPKGKATPLHAHPDAEESFLVLGGQITLHVDGTNHDVGPGATWMIRRGTPHAFAVHSHQAHLLVIFTPGGSEEFFIEAGEPALLREFPPPAKPDFSKYEAAAKTGLVLLGPPLFDLATL